MLQRLRHFVEYRTLPDAARDALRRDRQGLRPDPGSAVFIDTAMAWLARAQDCSATADGGVARDYSLIRGWASSYPETTGYIVPTFLDYARFSATEEPRRRAARMLDWLLSIQFADGAFQGGRIDASRKVPVIFNTGQILIGLARGVAAFGEHYRPAMRKAAGWLVAAQDPDGCWRKFPTPFARPGVKAYETHVAWGLLEAARLEPEAGYGEAGLRNVRWALTQQQDNGWIANCCLNDPARPLTHTLGYALRGVVEAHRFAADPAFLAAARRTADGLLSAQDPAGGLPGRLRPDWSAAAPWACLTGIVQIAWCWLYLYQATGEVRYRDAGFKANAFVRRTVDITGSPDQAGGVKGSFPVDGDYGRFEYLNWAAKFAIDSHLLELELRHAAAP
ncbi:MAG: terpene cyclase/mutase family protein [Pseudomonadota bacterium]|nr:terpene cyclase/mutase family protein [Pseudomonadota bacterium]